MDSAGEGYNDPFAGIYEPFAGLNDMDFELHGIYMDHEPEQEFVSSLNKCKDAFINVLLSDDNIRKSSMEDEIKAQVYHANEWQSDEDEKEVVKKTYRIHDPIVRWDKMEPKIGDVFESTAQLKFCVTNYAVSNGYEIYFAKCDSRRIVAKCGKRNEESKCPFRLYAAWMCNERSFQVKALVSDHICSRVFKFGSIVSPEWIGRHYVTEIANKPKLKLREMVTDISQKFKCVVSLGQVSRAKQWAKELIEGKLTEHYARIRDNGAELLRSNPGSTCKIGVTVNPDDKTYFHRFYICFKSISDCWKRGCRRVIGLDGCFLKGQMKGELLTAIGRDANNQVFPIAWVVVDVENKGNWTWFLELLNDDLELHSGRGTVVISDQHKGLLESVKDIWPHVEHRNCARHIYANFRKAYSGLEFKKLFWAASMSCVEGDFKRHMETMKKLSPGAYEYLMSKQPKTWCRAYFGEGYACEAVENGLSECFNSIIVEARKKPLITMLEEIRIYIMDRFAHMNLECTKWNTNSCPAVIKKLKMFGKSMRFWYVVYSLGHVFEVRRACDSYKVDLDNRSCSCRLWDLSGIPCVHAIAAINYIHETPDGYIHDYFSKEKFKECYSSNINPVNGSNLWTVTSYNKPLPPLARRMPGRPAVNRRRHVSENDSKFSTSRVKPPRSVRCSNCLEFGHNQKGCKNEKRPPVPVPPKKLGRPRKHQPAEEVIPSQASGTIPAAAPRQQTTPYQQSRPRKSARPMKQPNTNPATVPKQSQVKLTTPFQANVTSQSQGEQTTPMQTTVPRQSQVKQTPTYFWDQATPIQATVTSPVIDPDPIVPVFAVMKRKKLAFKRGTEGRVDPLVCEDMLSDDHEAGHGGSASQSEADGIAEDHEFTEGNAEDVLPEKVIIGVEQIADLLEAGYTMAEIECMKGIQVELGDMPPVEMELNYAEVVVNYDGDEGDVNFGENGVNAAADDEVNMTDTNLRKRKPSERSIVQKLKKVVYDKDGAGSISAAYIHLFCSILGSFLVFWYKWMAAT